MYYPEATCSQISGWGPLTNFTSCDPRPIHAPSIFLIPCIVEKSTVNDQKLDDGKAWEWGWLFKAENTWHSALRVYALTSVYTACLYTIGQRSCFSCHCATVTQKHFWELTEADKMLYIGREYTLKASGCIELEDVFIRLDSCYLIDLLICG